MKWHIMCVTLCPYNPKILFTMKKKDKILAKVADKENDDSHYDFDYEIDGKLKMVLGILEIIMIIIIGALICYAIDAADAWLQDLYYTRCGIKIDFSMGLRDYVELAFGFIVVGIIFYIKKYR